MSSRAIAFRSLGAVPKRRVRKRLRTLCRIETVFGLSPRWWRSQSPYAKLSCSSEPGAGGAAGEDGAITPASMRCLSTAVGLCARAAE